MPGIKGTRTEKNLLAAFAGEAQASQRYAFFSKKAKKEGFEQIAAILQRTAEEETAHASAFYKLLEGGHVVIEATYVAGGNASTSANLRGAAEVEHEEWTRLYPGYAAVAREEGLPHAAHVFDTIATIERSHETRDLRLLAHIDNGTVFKRETPVVWRCRKCGYLHEGTEALAACPACGHPQSYFEVFGQDW
jgi:rubrerythrin